MEKRNTYLDKGIFIVSADDYGLRDASSAILSLARSGKLDRVAVMADRVSQADADALVATGVAIDIHLELTRLVGSGENGSAQGIRTVVNFASRFLSGRLSPRAVGGEWERQLERFKELFGRKPDGWNVHEHYHYFPIFFRVLVGFVERHGDGFVRFGKRGVFFGTRPTFTAFVLSVLWHLCRPAFGRHPAPTSGYMASFDWFSGREDELFDRTPHGTVELVFHPERPEEKRWIEEHITVKSPK
ncbi:MAG: ChbG/HpnK family deacetylase [Candidatus Moranbacteria bacterium]|nr:ChbG/HpnK family deacetylase [Candidatus Moranbacteria bacterium]NTW76051.1 ChbG/HpnK family deacetylase [Candidatus Moranbacteria bacterium]